MYFFNVWLCAIGGLWPFHPFFIKSSLLVKYKEALIPVFKSWIILKSCYWIADAIWNTEHRPYLAYDNAWWEFMIPPVAIIYASFKR